MITILVRFISNTPPAYKTGGVELVYPKVSSKVSGKHTWVAARGLLICPISNESTVVEYERYMCGNRNVLVISEKCFCLEAF